MSGDPAILWLLSEIESQISIIPNQDTTSLNNLTKAIEAVPEVWMVNILDEFLELRDEIYFNQMTQKNKD